MKGLLFYGHQINVKVAASAAPPSGHDSQSRAFELACALPRSSCCTCGLAFASLTAFVAAFPTADVSNCCCRAAACTSAIRSVLTPGIRFQCMCYICLHGWYVVNHNENPLLLLRVHALQHLLVCPCVVCSAAPPRLVGHCNRVEEVRQA
jgi:hypothetical protein